MPIVAERCSTSDVAYEALSKLIERGELSGWGSSELTESDTRSKYIDPFFKEVLGWQETEIRREAPAGVGFSDYVFGAEYPWFHVEAKRVSPRFSIEAPSHARILKLNGPHLLGNRDLRPYLEQAARYSPELGTEFSVLTNGAQLVVFRTRLRGRSWRDGIALVWHDFADIMEHFAELYGLLSRDAVRKGSLIEAFEKAESITVNLTPPIAHIWNPDAELVRNRFWSHVSRVLGPLLTDEPEDQSLQDEIISHCYVTSPLSDEADSNIDRLLRDKLPTYLAEAGAVHLQQGMKGTAFYHSLESDVKARRPGTYLLTGGVGSGKTTFLKRFARVSQAAFVARFCIWLHVDYLSMGGVEGGRFEEELRVFTYRRIRELLEQDYAAHCPKDGAAIRLLFAEQIQRAALTRLYGLDKDSPAWVECVNTVVDQAYRNDETYSLAVLHAALKRGFRVVVVLDNTDQLGEKFQEQVFLLSQAVSRDCDALAIVAIREEKFFAAYRRGIFDAYGDRRFHIGSPSLQTVIRKRLEYGLKKYCDSKVDSDGSGMAKDQVVKVIRMLIRSTTKKNQNIIRMLSCVSNGDMRYALGMFREFVSSGNTDIDKMLTIVKADGGYTVPFHEFAKSAILGSRRYYRGSSSHIPNLFVRASARESSHLTACRILARLASAQGSPSSHGEGFVDTSQLLSEYRQSFGVAEDFMLRGAELLGRSLLESEPPRVQSIDATDALRISASGAYFWHYLVRSFAYLDLMFVDTPIADGELASRLASMASLSNMSTRFERVRAFLEYLEKEEARELEMSLVRDGPFRASLVREIREQIEDEIKVIRKKTKAKDLSA